MTERLASPADTRVETHPGSRATRSVVGAVSVLLLFAPALAFAVGDRGEPMENRAAVEFGGFDAGWYSLASFGQYIADRLPLRSNAVTADAWLDENVFQEDPAFGGGSSPRVVRGADGFLFLADAIDVACAPNAPAEVAAANLDRLATIISESGRNVLTMVAPDKSTIHPELLPNDLPKAACFAEYTDALWGDLHEAEIPGFVDLRAALTDASAASREPLYLRKDSHWDSAGSLVAVERAVEHFAPGLWDDDEIHYLGLTDYVGDLTGLQGHPESDQAPRYVVRRPDVTLESITVIDDIEGGFNRRFINAGPEDRLIQGRSLMFLDSFGLAALQQIVPYFADLTVMRLVDFDAERFADLIDGADNVWLLSVERSSGYRLTEEIGSEAFFTALSTTLGG